MKTLLRNTLPPLLLIGPLALFCAYMASDTTKNAPQFYRDSLLYPQLFCALSLGILVFALYRLPRAQAMYGFLIGTVVGGTIAVGTGMFGMMMLAFSGDAGMDKAAEVLPATLSIFAALVLGPLVMGAGLGALIGQNISRPAPQVQPGGPA
ncbi:hypothetical protein IT575_05630 [bacterium]|nr:hypothetical protein [bacterium]